MGCKLGNYTFNSLEKSTRKIPAILKTNNKQFNLEHYYKNCKDALKDNAFYIRFINPDLLSFEQYKELCITAIKAEYNVIRFINKKKLKKNYYYNICREMLFEFNNLQIEDSLMLIDSSLLSAEQYYDIIKTSLNKYNKKS